MELQLPEYKSSRHPIEVWQEWYNANIDQITAETEQAKSLDPPIGLEIRALARYEYTDALNTRQIWEPYLTGRERQQFDSHLMEFMRTNKNEVVMLRPPPQF